MTIIHKMIVLKERKDEVEKLLKKLTKKANKYGNEPITYKNTGTTFIEKDYEINKDGKVVTKKVKVPALIYQVTGSAPKINGYEFLAKIEPISPKKNLIHKVPLINHDISVNERFKTTGTTCEHCNINRYRKDVYIVRNTTNNEQIQVGKTCLQDYLGVNNPEKLLKKFKYWKEIKDLNFTKSIEEWYSVEAVLAYGNAVIRQYGFNPKSSEHGEPTSNIVWKILNPSPNNLEEQILAKSVRDEDYTVAKKVMEFISNNKSHSNYFYNLKVLVEAEQCKLQHLGILVSAVHVYNKETQKQKIQKEKLNEFYGDVGDKVELDDLTLTNWKVVSGHYGYTDMVTFEDSQGRTFLTYYSGNNIDWHTVKDMSPTIKGTIKKHNKYNGIKQTVLTRVKIKQMND